MKTVRDEPIVICVTCKQQILGTSKHYGINHQIIIVKPIHYVGDTS